MGPKHLGEEFTVKYSIKKINFRNPENGFSIVLGKIKEHDSKDELSGIPMVIKGYYQGLYEGDTFESRVVMLEDKRSGYYLQVVGMNKLQLPHQSKELAKFIKKRTVKIGEKLIIKAVDQIGLDFADKIKNNKEILMEVQGMTKNKADQIYNSVISHIYFEDLTTYLVTNGISSNIANDIYDKWGEASLYKIKENPYSLCRIKGISFAKADKLAYVEQFKYDSHQRINSAIYKYIDMRVENAGDICVTKQEIISGLNYFLQKYGSFGDENKKIDDELIKKQLNYLLKNKKLVREEIKGEEDKDFYDRNCWIYFPMYLEVENTIVSSIVQMLFENFLSPYPKSQIDKFLNKYENDSGYTLDKKQKDAVYNSLQNRLSILSGGPGTGKTQTMNTIVKCILAIKPDAKIVLMAPTGKAGNRITELTNLPASTIHRKLKINSYDGAGSDSIEQIDADFVIVDESSMIDAFIFKELLVNIGNETSLLLVGDYHQLPSVGPGLIFRDLIMSKIVPTVVLTTIFRQGQDSQIVMNSKRIIEGKTTNDETDPLTFDKSKNDFEFIEVDTQQEAQETIIKVYGECLKQYKPAEVSLLSPMNVGELGTVMINNILQSIYNKRTNPAEEYVISHGKKFKINDKVIHTKNNKDLDVFNGETGIVTYIGMCDPTSMETYIGVKYPNKEDAVLYDEKTAKEQLELAYAITIHKSQGSEYPVVIMPIMSVHEIMLNCNLIYTGWTRAKKKVICIGSKDALNKAIQAKPKIERRSQLKEKLMKFAH